MRITLSIAALALALVLAGCAMSLPWESDALPGLTSEECAQLLERPPRLWVAYYPYEERRDRPAGVRPTPDYTGWTDRRMQADAARLRECGCHGLAVALTPAQLAAPDVLERLERLAGIAADAGLQVTVLLTQPEGAAPLLLDGENLARFLEGTPLARHPAFLRRQGRLALFYDREAIRVSPSGAELALLPVGAVGEDSAAVPLVRVGDSGGCLEATPQAQRTMWPLPRRRGIELMRQLHAAAANGAEEAILHSWNRYRDGSFAEPNSLDGVTITDLLRRVLVPDRDEALDD